MSNVVQKGMAQEERAHRSGEGEAMIKAHAQFPTAGSARASVVRVERSAAVVSRIGRDGAISRCSVERGPDSQEAFFARIVEAAGDHDRLIVLGRGASRLAFEREYVEICHRPDRLVDVPAEK